MSTEKDLLDKLKGKSISLKMEMLDSDDDKTEKKIKKKLKRIKKEIKELEEKLSGSTSSTTINNKGNSTIVTGVSGRDFVFGDVTTNNKGEKKEDKKKVKVKKISFICSSPSGKNPLDFGEEFKTIKKAQKQSTERDSFQIEIDTGVEADYFINLLSEKPYPYIVHISMHASKSLGLYFEDRNGNEYPMPVEQFAEKFKMLSEKQRPELVVLSACNSIKYAEAILPYVQYVIGSKDFLPDEIASIYAKKFYEILFSGNNVQFAHNAACDSIKNAPIPEEEKERLKTPLHEILVLLSNT